MRFILAIIHLKSIYYYLLHITWPAVCYITSWDVHAMAEKSAHKLAGSEPMVLIVVLNLKFVHWISLCRIHNPAIKSDE